MSFHPYIAPFPSMRRIPNRYVGLYAIPWHPFNPHEVELPKFHKHNHTSQQCYQQCLAFGFQPGVTGWTQCLHGCQSLLGSLLNDPKFVDDMMDME
ncbi:MAG: hypothetical protein LPK26_02115 [Bacillaceae bacterium]|nr:hypothetical protein [Bacillaceae bacterium]